MADRGIHVQDIVYKPLKWVMQAHSASGSTHSITGVTEAAHLMLVH